jgi:hypothetical protein
MAETLYEARQAVLRVALPDEPALLEEAQDRVAALTAGASVLNPQGTEWVDVPRQVPA